jgi:rare lipoprotein A (peptidoglycan hydrolase)
MKPHATRSADRRFSFGASAGLLLLVSACSTFSLPSDSGPTAAPGETALAVATEEPEPDAIAMLPPVPPAPRQRRRITPAAPSASLPTPALDPFAQRETAPADPQLQALIDSPAGDGVLEQPVVAGPVPKLEPLAHHANRPYRLRGRKYRPLTELQPFRQRGVASWYGRPFHGRRTATGERFDMNAMTAAHPTLPLPSYVRVTNLQNGTSVIVRVNDRGPFAHDRVIDLSKEAARHLGILKGGLAAVELNLIVPEPTGTEMPAPVAGIAD